MANLINRHPDLALHLSDRTLTPLVTSARDQQQHDALASLSHAAFHAHQTAQRLGFGKPKRIIVEHANNGPLVLQTFVAAEPVRQLPLPASPSAHNSTAASGLITPQHGGPAGGRSPNTHTTTPSSRGTSTPVAGTSTNGAVVPFDSPGSGISPRQTHRIATAGGLGDYIQPGEGDAGTMPIHHELTLSMPGLISIDDDDDLDEEEDANSPPMLLGIVVASSAESTSNARRAAAGLERVARIVQAQWTEG
ncbi:uncharacterized protein B0I36DRAFT_352087 [Microdochium trichocladiopsis]|uniref:Uncharacterized protein n=1 Tax=Microdochium trichocladiopsis TaxID=1682393 RepID=A0A9P9BME3_9PEZI|nr:uncharacterized protein B0I36DRAFT_352087 [Microdochium trichocladiopsis]KAH7026188.1 hypothetical protein B0I36DRAFT_352087 [Microdochium trichocladiopsis]